MADLERLNEMLASTMNRAAENGFNLELEDPEDAESKTEAYVLGRYEQLLSVLDETEGSDVGDLF